MTTNAPNLEHDGFEIEVLSKVDSEVAVPVPGGCNSSSNSSSNDGPQEVGTDG